MNEIEKLIQLTNLFDISDFESKMQMHNIIFIVISIIAGIVFIFVIAMFISPKLKGKFMSRQIKAMKHMTDYSASDFESIGTNLGQAAVNIRKNIITNNKDSLKEMANAEAEIRKDAIKTTTRAIKEGFTGTDETIFCKHCGSTIDSDSKFCKACGKEL